MNRDGTLPDFSGTLPYGIIRNDYEGGMVDVPDVMQVRRNLRMLNAFDPEICCKRNVSSS